MQPSAKSCREKFLTEKLNPTNALNHFNYNAMTLLRYRKKELKNYIDVSKHIFEPEQYVKRMH